VYLNATIFAQSLPQYPDEKTPEADLTYLVGCNGRRYPAARSNGPFRIVGGHRVHCNQVYANPVHVGAVVFEIRKHAHRMFRRNSNDARLFKCLPGSCGFRRLPSFQVPLWDAPAPAAPTRNQQHVISVGTARSTITDSASLFDRARRRPRSDCIDWQARHEYRLHRRSLH
jgi:hypothetical protein